MKYNLTNLTAYKLGKVCAILDDPNVYIVSTTWVKSIIDLTIEAYEIKLTDEEYERFIVGYIDGLQDIGSVSNSLVYSLIWETLEDTEELPEETIIMKKAKDGRLLTLTIFEGEADEIF